MSTHAPACPAFRHDTQDCTCGAPKTRPKSSWELRAEKAEAQRDQLRAALVKLLGVDGREDLEQLEVAVRMMPAPAEAKVVSVDAIHALLATLEA